MSRSGCSILAAALAAAMLVGCGSSSSSGVVGATAYAQSLCTALAPFERDIAARSSALNLDARRSPAQGKAALEGFLQAIASDTATAVKRMRAAGAPNIANGKGIADQFVALFGRLQSTLQMAVRQADALPTSSPTAFQSAAVALGSMVKSSMNDLGSAEVKSAPLEAAARKVKVCQTLG